MERWFEDECIRRGLIQGQRRPLQPEKPHPGSVLNRAFMAMKDGKKALPQEVRDALKNEDGDELEIVNEQLPEQHDPDRQGESE